MDKICIMMATYNGENYINDQIESIINQSFSDWELYINDDGSTDNTIDIINKFKKNDSRVHLLNLNNGRKGQLNNFSELMTYVSKLDFEYFMFSDQDDVWSEDKIAKTLSFMKEKDVSDEDTLVYTNYYENSEFDSKNKIHVKYSDEFNYKTPQSYLLIQNWIMGCTTMINRSLLNRSINVPSEADNHDNWLVLLSLTYGEVFYLDSPTMFHRLHAENVTNSLGQSKLHLKLYRFLKIIKNRKKWHEKKVSLVSCVLERGEVTRTNYVSDLGIILKQKSKISRISSLIKRNFFGLNLHKTVELWALI